MFILFEYAFVTYAGMGLEEGKNECYKKLVGIFIYISCLHVGLVNALCFELKICIVIKILGVNDLGKHAFARYSCTKAFIACAHYFQT